jgi:hypothetical protein
MAVGDYDKVSSQVKACSIVVHCYGSLPGELIKLSGRCDMQTMDLVAGNT